ncbi:MAG: D-alanine--D-alanine ligase [Planctomycetes bacterium]|nr:D-alanine--D-alanine ligase [Planctomycetota bacterium]
MHPDSILDRPVRVAVLMGGVSREREVSLASGRAVARALAHLGHPVLPVDVADRRLGALEGLRADLAFLVLHGTFGEDGEVQERLEAVGLPYTGSGPEASRAAFDKLEAKRRFALVGIPTPPHRVVRAAAADPRHVDRAIREGFGYPAVMKPSSEGSSIGVSIVEGPADLPSALGSALRCGPVALVEPRVRGREYTIGVLEGRALPPIAPLPGRAFSDSEAKYRDPTTRYLLDDGLEGPRRAELEDAALRAHEALGCRDFSRVDVILEEGGPPRVLEVNTLPGLTEKSLLPKAAAARGIPFPELCERMMRLALGRAAATGSASAALALGGA